MPNPWGPVGPMAPEAHRPSYARRSLWSTGSLWTPQLARSGSLPPLLPTPSSLREAWIPPVPPRMSAAWAPRPSAPSPRRQAQARSRSPRRQTTKPVPFTFSPSRRARRAQVPRPEPPTFDALLRSSSAGAGAAPGSPRRSSAWVDQSRQSTRSAGPERDPWDFLSTTSSCGGSPRRRYFARPLTVPQPFNLSTTNGRFEAVPSVLKCRQPMALFHPPGAIEKFAPPVKPDPRPATTPRQPDLLTAARAASPRRSSPPRSPARAPAPA
mmetsp:Transcript_11162/g.24077  ORF Transcript_11162/g.24077 Transcript_11162/m.24077 type:complete len:268 (-) Transcript_11162:20-823(-)